MKYLSSLLAIAVLTSTATVAAKALPIGSTFEYKEGATRGYAITPDGRRVEVKLSDYDQWWLKKDQSEQSAWLELWLETVESYAPKINPNLTFVEFMNDVMNNNLVLDDLRIANEAQLEQQNIPAYAKEIGMKRCINYRAGMSFDEGRAQAEKLVSDKSKRERAQVITLGSPNSRPTVIGLLKMAIDINASVGRECMEEASYAHSKGSAYDK